jgi:hypothetical protein
VRPRIELAANEAFIAGLNDILLVAFGIALVGAVAALLLVRQSDFTVAPGAEGAPAAA